MEKPKQKNNRLTLQQLRSCFNHSERLVRLMLTLPRIIAPEQNMKSNTESPEKHEWAQHDVTKVCSRPLRV